MDSLFATLSTLLPSVPPEALRAALPLWGAVQLRQDTLLWKQGRPADSLAIVVDGELEVLLDGTVLGTIAAGEMVGETALFAQTGRRFASMRASASSVVLVLSSAALHHLRSQSSPVYRAVLNYAIAVTAVRAQNLDRQVAQVRKGNFATPLPPAQKGALARLWRRVTRAPANPGSCPPLADLLGNDPVLAQSRPEARTAIFRAFEPRSFRAGELLVRQGDDDSRVFVLAAGKVDVLRTIEEQGGALLLGKLDPGAIFGINAFVGGSRRTASVLAGVDGWRYAMHREAFEALPIDAYTAWLEITLSEYIRQYQRAAQVLQAAIGVFASRHDDLMASRTVPRAPERPKKPRSNRE